MAYGSFGEGFAQSFDAGRSYNLQKAQLAIQQQEMESRRQLEQAQIKQLNQDMSYKDVEHVHNMAASIVYADPDERPKVYQGILDTLKAEGKDPSQFGLDPQYSDKMYYTANAMANGMGKVLEYKKDLYDMQLQGQKYATGTEKDLRDERMQESKQFMDTDNSWQRAIQSASQASKGTGDVGASDIALMSNVFHMMNPGAVSVNNAGQAEVTNPGGLPEQLFKRYQTLTTGGGTLSPDERASLIKTGQALYQSATQQQQQVDDRYYYLARKEGMDPSTVVTPLANANKPVYVSPNNRVYAGDEPLLKSPTGKAYTYMDVMASAQANKIDPNAAVQKLMSSGFQPVNIQAQQQQPIPQAQPQQPGAPIQ